MPRPISPPAPERVQPPTLRRLAAPWCRRPPRPAVAWMPSCRCTSLPPTRPCRWPSQRRSHCRWRRCPTRCCKTFDGLPPSLRGAIDAGIVDEVLPAPCHVVVLVHGRVPDRDPARPAPIRATGAQCSGTDQDAAIGPAQIAGAGLALVPVVPLLRREPVAHPARCRHVVALARHHRAGPAAKPPTEIVVGHVEH